MLRRLRLLAVAPAARGGRRWVSQMTEGALWLAGYTDGLLRLPHPRIPKRRPYVALPPRSWPRRELQDSEVAVDPLPEKVSDFISVLDQSKTFQIS